MISLRLTEIFYSLQGEAATAGWPTVFVRLTGCPLRCTWCDTAYAFNGGDMMTLPAILGEVGLHAPRFVTVTGGEPLAQPGCIDLLVALCDAGYDVSLETSGALPIDAVDERVSRVVDFKPPDSGEVARNRWANVSALTQRDQVKFVIASRADYEWSRFKVDEHRLHERVQNVLFSPVADMMPATGLAEWILADRLPVRMQLQLHKLLWGDKPGV